MSTVNFLSNLCWIWDVRCGVGWFAPCLCVRRGAAEMDRRPLRACHFATTPSLAVARHPPLTSSTSGLCHALTVCACDSSPVLYL